MDKELYLSSNKKKQLYKIITNHPDYIFYRAIKLHKKYYNAKKTNKKFKIFFYGIKANRYASKYNLELYGKLGSNVRIWHGNIIINGKAQIGNGVQFHGNNCIGEKEGKAPIIHDNVEIGYGTTIIGNVELAEDIIVGANSFVNKSFNEKGVVIAGCPAKIIK